MSKAAARAYDVIRDKILSGAFAPGTRLTEEELAAEIGVSRTPVRDALRNLAGEFYVTMVPNHGAFVTEWSPEDIQDIFELRAMLEGYGARRAAARASDAQLARLVEDAAIIDDALAAGGTPDIDLFLQANRRFHATVMEASGSERLALMVGRLVQQPVVARTARRYRPEDLRRSNAHHRELVDAVRARDGAWAESVMQSHLHAAYRVYQRAEAEERREREDPDPKTTA